MLGAWLQAAVQIDSPSAGDCRLRSASKLTPIAAAKTLNYTHRRRYVHRHADADKTHHRGCRKADDDVTLTLTGNGRNGCRAALNAGGICPAPRPHGVRTDRRAVRGARRPSGACVRACERAAAASGAPDLHRDRRWAALTINTSTVLKFRCDMLLWCLNPVQNGHTCVDCMSEAISFLSKCLTAWDYLLFSLYQTCFDSEKNIPIQIWTFKI